MNGAIQFSNGLVLKESIITQICEKVLLEIENELPEEARFYEVFSYVIDECKETLPRMKVVL